MTTSSPSPNDKPIQRPRRGPVRDRSVRAGACGRDPENQIARGDGDCSNGPWGSGKSSAVNLIQHHLKDAIAADEIVVVNFACWWFRGEEALALAFFRELYAGLGPSLGEKFKKILPKIGAQLLRAGAVVGAGADLAGYKGAGKAAEATLHWLADQFTPRTRLRSFMLS